MLGSEHWDCLLGKGNVCWHLVLTFFWGQQFYTFDVKYVSYEHSMTMSVL
jgi:hypothetical protein